MTRPGTEPTGLETPIGARKCFSCKIRFLLTSNHTQGTAAHDASAGISSLTWTRGGHNLPEEWDGQRPKVAARIAGRVPHDYGGKMMETEMAGLRSLTVGDLERWSSILGGGALIVGGLTRRSLVGVALLALGTDLIYHGLVRGNGHLHEVFGFETPQDRIPSMTIPHGIGIKVTRSITVNRPAEELYQFWRHLENLPRFMDHLESVKVIGDLRSHWIAKGPAGLKASWDAEIINDVPNVLIGWRSLENADVPNAGSVHFEKTRHGSSTRVDVVLKYSPPAGPLGEVFAKLFGQSPSQTVREDLHRFKHIVELDSGYRTQRLDPGTEVREALRAA